MGHASPLIFFKMAIFSLRRHPIRSCLALSGIVIGIAAMTVTMAIGEGANETFAKRNDGYGRELAVDYSRQFDEPRGSQAHTKPRKEARLWGLPRLKAIFFPNTGMHSLRRKKRNSEDARQAAFSRYPGL